ncbi:MAG: hypothetical protein ACYC6F_01245 [Longimicrobiales bacterium]
MFPPLPGLLPAPAFLFDERGKPDFRDVFGALARTAPEISTAVTRVRLTTVDLQPDEVPHLRHFRVLLCELSALRLEGEAHALLHLRRRAPNLRLLLGLLEDGRLEVRAAPLGGWSPDFTVFFGPSGPAALLSGFHAFERPYPHRGPALAALHGPEAASLAARRHQELWSEAHDVGPTLWTLLSRVQRVWGPSARAG